MEETVYGQRPARLVRAEAHISSMTERPQVKLGRKPVVHILILDETDAARPLDGRTRAFAVEEATGGYASGEIDAQIFADRGKFEMFTFQLQQRGQAFGLDWSGCHDL